MTTLTGSMRFLPLGMAHSLPPIPTGRMGTPARAATKAAPSKRGCTIGPGLAGPFGEEDHRFAAAHRLLADPERLSVGCPAMDRKGAQGAEQGPATTCTSTGCPCP